MTWRGKGAIAIHAPTSNDRCSAMDQVADGANTSVNTHAPFMTPVFSFYHVTGDLCAASSRALNVDNGSLPRPLHPSLHPHHPPSLHPSLGSSCVALIHFDGSIISVATHGAPFANVVAGVDVRAKHDAKA